MELNAVIARGATIMQYKICHGISSYRKILPTASSLSSPSFRPGSYATAVKVTTKDTETMYVSCFDIRIRGCVRIGVGKVGCGLGIVVSLGGFEFVKI